MELTSVSPVERVRRSFSVIAYIAVLGLLSAGLIVWWLNHTSAAGRLLQLGCGLLVAVPIVNLVAVMLEEVRGRDWGFVAAAAVVLAMVAYRVAGAF
jgi:hypothetical protein